MRANITFSSSEYDEDSDSQEEVKEKVKIEAHPPEQPATMKPRPPEGVGNRRARFAQHLPPKTNPSDEIARNDSDPPTPTAPPDTDAVEQRSDPPPKLVAGASDGSDEGSDDTSSYAPDDNAHCEDELQIDRDRAPEAEAERDVDAVTGDPVTVDEVVSPHETVIGHCVRKKLFRKREFEWRHDGELVMSAKASFKNGVIYAGDLGSETVLSFFKITKIRTEYVFVDLESNVQLKFKVGTKKEHATYHRYFQGEIMEGETVRNVCSKLPHKSASGAYTLNFGGKFVKRSIRNGVLCQDGQRGFVIRKIGDNKLEIENCLGFDDMAAFAVAIMSYMCVA